MESQPQNPEFMNNPGIFHPCSCLQNFLRQGSYILKSLPKPVTMAFQLLTMQVLEEI